MSLKKQLDFIRETIMNVYTPTDVIRKEKFIINHNDPKKANILRVLHCEFIPEFTKLLLKK